MSSSVEESKQESYAVVYQRVKDVLHKCRGSAEIEAELVKAAEDASRATRDGRSVMEIVLREEILHTVMENQTEACMRLLDIGLNLAEKRLVDASTPYLMLEDITSSLASMDIAAVFPSIESRVKVLSSSNFFVRGKQVKLVLLRTFVEFLRRCSRINDNALCGRTLTLLATAFPLSERSGVNVRGAYNVANVTEYATGSEKDGEEAIDVLPVDWNLYTTFWSLQKYLSRPYEAETLEVWKEVSTALDQVLNAFDSAPLLVADSGEVLSERGDHFVKFLTDPHLLRLQLGDVFFRRHILTQFLILLRHLRSVQKPEEAVKDGGDVPTESAVSRRIISLMDVIPPNGKDFTTGIMKGLYWERHWVKWKADGCKSFELTPITFTKGDARKKRKHLFQGASDTTVKKSRMIMPAVEDEDPSLQWAPTTEEERSAYLRSSEKSAPSVDTIVQQLHWDLQEEEELKRKHSRQYVWKVLRVLQEDNLWLIKKIADDKKFDVDAILPPEGATAAPQ